MSEITKIPGTLVCFRNDDEYVNEDTLLDVVNFTKDGTVEIMFNDRKENVYVSFRLQDLMSRIATLHGGE